MKEQLSYNLFIDNGFGRMINSCFDTSPFEAINSEYPNKFKEWEFNVIPMKFYNDIDNGIKTAKWLIEEKLNMQEDELKNKLSYNLFIDNGLDRMINSCFNGSPYQTTNSIYPGKYKEWVRWNY